MVLDGTDWKWYADQHASWRCHRHLPADQHEHVEWPDTDTIHTLHHNEWSDRQWYPDYEQLSGSHNPNRQYHARATHAGRLPGGHRCSATRMSRRVAAISMILPAP